MNLSQVTPMRRRPVTVAEADAIDARIGGLMGTINTATAQLVALIADVLGSDAWCGVGVRSPEHWVAWKCGVSRHRARRLVRLARRLGELPATEAAFTAGQLTEDQAHAVARRVPCAHDAAVAELAPRLTVGQLERCLGHLSPVPDPGPGGPVPAVAPLPERREVSFGFDDDGTWRLGAVLPPDEGAVVARALERARDAAFATGGAAVDWADGLLGMAEAALEALDPAVDVVSGRGRPADRFQVLVHVGADSPAGEGSVPGAHLHLGPPLPEALRRYLSCDATYRYVFEAAGATVALSSRQRTVDDRLRTVVEERDRGCRVPGCAQTRWLHIHHVRHYEDGGLTEAANLCCLCPFHHRLHHRGLLGIAGDPTAPDGLVFTDRFGRRLDRAPPVVGADVASPPARWQAPSGERMDHDSVIWGDPAA
jgi:hypothetical protein